MKNSLPDRLTSLNVKHTEEAVLLLEIPQNQRCVTYEGSYASFCQSPPFASGAGDSATALDSIVSAGTWIPGR